MNTQTLTIDEWVGLTRSGATCQVKTLLHGESMRPLIRKDQDPVTIIPVMRELMVGDVVLFTDGKRYVVHRLYRIDKAQGMVQTWGDGCFRPDSPVRIENVFGIVSDYTRDGKIYILDSEDGRRKGIQWMNSYPKRWLYLNFQRVKRKIKRIFKG